MHSAERSFSVFVTFSLVPKGYSLWAQVIAYMLKISPEEVGLP
jgi:hypothetical protein